jgi:hypothetical protein
MSNFYSPQNITTYNTRQAEQAQQQAAAEQATAQRAAAEQQGALVQNVGPAVVAMIRKYTDGYVRADYDQVQRDFLSVYPSATYSDYHETVEALIQSGHIQTARGPEGLMGVRSVYMYAV